MQLADDFDLGETLLEHERKGLITLTPLKEKEEEAEKPKQKKSQAEILLNIAHESLVLFHDQHGEPFCFYQKQALPLKSGKLKDILSYGYYNQNGKAPNSDAINQAIGVLKGKAIFENPQIELHNRIAWHDGAIWYDMGDGTAIKIESGTWEHIINTPVLFRKYSHQKRQTSPCRQGDVQDIFKFLNVDKEHQLLVLVYLISCYIPEIPHPICHPHGAQGSGKTTFCKVLKEFIDPSSLSTLILQRDYTQLIQAIAHHYFVPFDNLSDLPGWVSDILSIACTGGGLSKRQLFTDEEDVILSMKRCIGLNAINELISKADLMDRAILLHLERIAPARRRDETEFWAEFEKHKAEILGGIFAVLAKAIDIYPSVKLPYLPRMADFSKWGYAIAEAIQKGGGLAFIQAYTDNIKRQNEEIIQSNTLILSIMKQMYQKSVWEGTIKTVYNQLFETACPDKNDPTFPRTERTLRKHLERIKTTLNDAGINFKIGLRTAEGTPITFLLTAIDFPKDRKFDAFATSSTFATPEGEPNTSKNEANAPNEANEANFANSGKPVGGNLTTFAKDDGEFNLREGEL